MSMEISGVILILLGIVEGKKRRVEKMKEYELNVMMQVERDLLVAEMEGILKYIEELKGRSCND